MQLLRTRVAIIGAGPAGLMLAHLLHAQGIDVVVLERQTPDHVQGRIRAGVLERVTVDIMTRLGLDDRMRAEGLVEEGFCLADGERLIRIDIAELTGQTVMVYGQTEIQRDLVEAAQVRGLDVRWQIDDIALHALDSDTPWLTCREGEIDWHITADFIIGCDGFHGVSRRAVPASAAQIHERVYPFAWLGILADVPPCHHELIYANHSRGFALASLRSPTRSRYYIDAPTDTRLADWPEQRLWDELAMRLGPTVAARITQGPALEISLAPLRSFVFEPMRHGRLLLCGDAAHIVPPTGAKGLNLAASDVHYAAQALTSWYAHNDNDGIAHYAGKALARVWQAQRFSWSLTRLVHRFPEDGRFERAMQLAEFNHIAGSRAAQMAIAENYVGLPV